MIWVGVVMTNVRQLVRKSCHRDYNDNMIYLCPVSQKVKINLKFDFYGILPLKSIVRSILSLHEMGPWFTRTSLSHESFTFSSLHHFRSAVSQVR